MSAIARKSVSESAHGALRAERDRFVGFAFAAADLLLEVDRDGLVRFATGAAQHVAGEAAESLVGHPLAALLAEPDRRLIEHLLVQLSTRARLRPITVTLAKAGQRALLGACRLDESGTNYNFTLTRIVDPAIAPAADAERDSSSGALGKEDFAAFAGRMVASGAARDGCELSFFELVGLDAFKERLDGPAVAEFFSETGAYLRASSVGGDVVGRLAENKFGLLHSQAVDADEIRERIRAFARERDPDGRGLEIAHQGIGLDDTDLDDSEVANVLAYTIKIYVESRDGDLTIENLSQGFQELAKHTAAATLALKRAIEQGAFDIVFQPIVDLAARDIHHYEVLSRFANGASPAKMVALAENVGLIEDFDLAVFRRAVEVVRAESAAGRCLTLAVNVSGRSLLHPPMVDAVRRTLMPLGALRERVLIELTETSQIRDLEHAERVLRILRGDGIRICLDDFGAGASSFRYVQALPVNFVKIDGAYIENILDSQRDAAILKAMVALCDGLDVATIAERVETSAQADRLKSFGIKFGQGWLFGKPSKDIPPPLRLERPRAAKARPEHPGRRAAHAGKRSQPRAKTSGSAT